MADATNTRSLPFDSRVVEAVLRVEDDEHPLVELAEELPERVLEVNLATVIVLLKILEQERKGKKRLRVNCVLMAKIILYQW